MKKKVLFFFFSLVTVLVVAQKNTSIYLDDSIPIEERVQDALSKMTLEEKVALCHAQSKFSVSGVPRLGIPDLWTNDGPHGVKSETLWNSWEYAKWTNDFCTAFPALTCLSATWNPQMSFLYGESLGAEARYRKKDVILGPTINIYRTPLFGRNFESMGEDPYLTSKIVVPYIHGMQKNGVAACVKHFAVNNQEADRLKVNVEVSDRALHEIYLPAFKAAVIEGKAWSLMGSYNKFRGQFCSYNEILIQQILKQAWKFDGVVISDWGATHSTKEAALHGLDLEMGTDGFYREFFFASPFLKMLKSGEISVNILDDKVRRILRLIFRTSMNRSRPWGSFATEEHALVSRKIAEEGIVLLKNENDILPIDGLKYKNILVVGENAIKKMTIGGGSSELRAKQEITPLKGIKNRFGLKSNVTYLQGYVSVYRNGTTQARGGNAFEAIEAAKKADLVIYIGGLNKEHGQDSEQADRADMDLPYGQDKLINALVDVNKNTIVVLISGNAVSMPWVSKISVIVQAWYGGSEAGNAIASILSGDVNPSGKLPMTFPVKLTDNGAHSSRGGEYPGDGVNVHYRDDIFVGYRWFEKEKIKPLFSFGHGLSYTTFEYGKISLDKNYLSVDEIINISIPIKNTGKRDGAEVVQLYIKDEKSSLVRPEKELKGFQKIFLKKGEEQIVNMTISPKDLQFYDDIKQSWIVEPGKFTLFIGSSSTDVRQKTSFVYE
jgi:beta-glucosidase